MLLASLFIQLFALITPLFFQVVIDKVLPHKVFPPSSLWLLACCWSELLTSFSNSCAPYALNHTTCRIDVELGARLFDHLLKLPLAYFETRPAGQTVARVRELETVRAFLTGQGLSSIIDLLFAVIFVSVLFIYSPCLTLIVLACTPFYILIAMNSPAHTAAAHK